MSLPPNRSSRPSTNRIHSLCVDGKVRTEECHDVTDTPKEDIHHRKGVRPEASRTRAARGSASASRRIVLAVSFRMQPK